MIATLPPDRKAAALDKYALCALLAVLIAGCSPDKSSSDRAEQGESAAPSLAPDRDGGPPANAAPENGQASGTPVVAAPNSAPKTAAPAPDFADGDAGGPDFWAVSGVASNDVLNIRASASPDARIVGSVPNGTVLRSLGCRTSGSSRWCRVGSLADDGVDGWVNGRFLRESGPPTTRPVPAQRPAASRPPADGTPELVRRPSGEYEIRYASGCTLLLDANGKPLTQGATCSAAQAARARDAVAAYRREQGL